MLPATTPYGGVDMISYTHKAREAAATATAIRENTRVRENLRRYITSRTYYSPTTIRTYVGGQDINLSQVAAQFFR